MTDPMKPLFDALREIKGKPLTEADVLRFNVALDAAPLVQPEVIAEKPVYLGNTIDHLEVEEGRVPSAYQDHLGFWTIGIGRLIDKRKGGRLTNAEINLLLSNDIAEKAADMQGWPAWEKVKDDPVRATALLSMCFQLGAAGLAKFTGSLPLIAAGKWSQAADALLQSLWARQTPARAKRVTDMIRTGKMP